MVYHRIIVDTLTHLRYHKVEYLSISHDNENINKDDVEDLIAIFDNIVGSIERLVPASDKTLKIIEKILNLNELSDFLAKLACYPKDYLEKLIQSEKYRFLRKYEKLFLQEVAKKTCKHELSESRLAMKETKTENITQIFEKFGINKDQMNYILKQYLGKDLSIKDFITEDIRLKLLKEYARDFAKYTTNNCITSYCVAIKLSSLWIKIKDLSEIMEWNPKKAMEIILFSDEVQEKAVKWPLDDIELVIEKPQFKDLWKIKEIIIDWANQVKSNPLWNKYKSYRTKRRKEKEQPVKNIISKKRKFDNISENIEKKQEISRPVIGKASDTATLEKRTKIIHFLLITVGMIISFLDILFLSYIIENIPNLILNELILYLIIFFMVLYVSYSLIRIGLIRNKIN